MRYWAPYNGVSGNINSNDGYADGDPTTGAQGSIPTFRPFEQMQRELCNFVSKSGLTLDAALDGIQVAQAIQKGRVNFADDTGTANNVVVALDPVPPAYAAGMRVWFTPAFSNTGASTINVSGLGARDIVRLDASAVQAGDMLADMGTGVVFNGTAFNLITTTPQQVRQLAFARQRTVITATGAYTFTVPANVFYISAKAWGAGGGGGGAAAGTPGGAASGGGSGAYAADTFAVTPGQTITGSIGSGGNQGTSGANGGAGGNTTFVYGGVTRTAGGGVGGFAAVAGVQQNSVSGGTITNGDITSHIGAVSASGAYSHNGTVSSAQGGNGGSAPGGGGAGGNAGAGNGNGGAVPGGGGGGGGGTTGSVATGGAGARGEVWFEY
jgi:hypothetical protein